MSENASLGTKDGSGIIDYLSEADISRLNKQGLAVCCDFREAMPGLQSP